MDKNKSGIILKSVTFALLFLCLYVSIEYVNVLFRLSNKIKDVAIQHDGVPIIVYQDIFLLSILYLSIIIGFLYSSIAVSRKNPKGRSIGLTLTIFCTILLFIDCLTRQEVNSLNILCFIVSGYVIFSLSLLSIK